MSHRIGNITVLTDTPPANCELCGKLDELRPYGPNNEYICFDCGMKDEATTQAKMDAYLFGDDTDA